MDDEGGKEDVGHFQRLRTLGEGLCQLLDDLVGQFFLALDRGDIRAALARQQQQGLMGGMGMGGMPNNMNNMSGMNAMAGMPDRMNNMAVARWLK